MEFCIETQTLKGILPAIYFVLTCEISPAGAGQGEENFSAEKRTCVNLGLSRFALEPFILLGYVHNDEMCAESTHSGYLLLPNLVVGCSRTASDGVKDHSSA